MIGICFSHQDPRIGPAAAHVDHIMAGPSDLWKKGFEWMRDNGIQWRTGMAPSFTSDRYCFLLFEDDADAMRFMLRFQLEDGYLATTHELALMAIDP